MAGINIYFDIDGVLNRYGPLRSFPGQDPADPSADRWPAYTAAGGLMSWPPEMITRINRMIAPDDVTPYWLTTWESEAGWFGSQVGLEGSAGWTWLPAVGVDASGRWQKYASIRSHIARTDPVFAVWLDDDLAHNRDARRWARRTGRVLALAPDGIEGLLPSQLSRVEQLVAAARRTGRSPL